MRIHRSYIIALDKIKSVEKNRIRIGDELLPVSDTYRDAFYAILERKGIV